MADPPQQQQPGEQQPPHQPPPAANADAAMHDVEEWDLSDEGEEFDGLGFEDMDEEEDGFDPGAEFGSGSDEDESYSDWGDDEDEDDEEGPPHLTPQQRVSLECGVLRHEAAFTLQDEPIRHTRVASSAHHHQTADALTFLPRPAAGGSAAAGAAAGGASSQEEVLVSCSGVMCVHRLEEGQDAKLLARCGTLFRHYSIAASPCGHWVAGSGATGLLSLFRVQRSSSAGAQRPSSSMQLGAAAAAGGDDSGAEADADAGGNADLPWQLVHTATLLCKNGPETMLNSVRFVSFGGRLRLCAAHQDGMLYMFNLPSPGDAAASTPAGAAGAAAPANGAELMIAALPSWEPLGSQINRSLVERTLALLPASQAPAAPGAGAVAAALQPQQQEQQEQQQQAASLDSARDPAGLPGVEPQLDAEAGSLPQLLAATSQAERLLPIVLPWLSTEASPREALIIDAMRDAILEQQGQNWQQPCGRLQRYGDRAAALGQLLQDEKCLLQLQHMQQYRLSLPTLAGLAQQVPALGEEHRREFCSAAASWSRAVDSLRQAVDGQWALLGAHGGVRQQRQWQRQAADGDNDADVAAARAVYLLLLLRLLAPIAIPRIQSGARVLVLRHGPHASQQAPRRLATADVMSAPRLATCAITAVGIDWKQAREIAQLRAAAERQLAAAPDNPHTAAMREQIAQFAARECLLPLNIAEASPDGAWLAVGSDQLCITLLPSGPGYQHRAATILDLCPLPTPTADIATQGTLGCQYISFNASSTRVAASCDALRLVVVFSVAPSSLGQRLATFAAHNRPILPIRFLPPRHATPAAAGAAAAAAPGPATAGAPTGVSARDVLAMSASTASSSAAAATAAATSSSSSSSLEQAEAALRDGLLGYCEVNGGVHIADLGLCLGDPHPRMPGSAQHSATANHFFITSCLELSPKKQQPAAAAGGGGKQQQQQQQAAADVAGDKGESAQAAAAAAAGGGGGGGGGGAYDYTQAPRINGLALTPSGRLLVACQTQLLEWRIITGWSRAQHARFPPALRAAAKLLLLAAGTAAGTPPPAGTMDASGSGDGSSSSTGSNNSSGQQLLSQLPGPVLERILAAAALPPAAWAAASVPSARELMELLEARPYAPPPQGPVMFWPNLQLDGAAPVPDVAPGAADGL